MLLKSTRQEKLMLTKHKLILYATTFAIILTALTYIIPGYAALWLSLEVITLPVIYSTFYEKMMEKQKRESEMIIRQIAGEFDKIKKEKAMLKYRLEELTRDDEINIKRGAR